MPTEKKDPKSNPRLILDKHRGIYFGYVQKVQRDEHMISVDVIDMRHCFYYPVAEAGHRGVYGLVTIGPGDSAKIGPRVSGTIYDVVKVIKCEKQAVEKWESRLW